MPEIADSHFPQYRKRTTHEWDTWLDGQIWSFQAGEDFDGDPHNFRRLARACAEHRGLTVTVRVRRGEVRIQAHPAP